MSFVIADRVKETTTTSGTGTVSLLGASTGYQSFSAGIGDGNSTYYCIASQTLNTWEVGIGTYTSSGSTLSRTTVLNSSSGVGTLVNFGSETKDVFVTYPAEKSVNQDTSGNVTVTGVFTAPEVVASNGVIVNSSTISSSYTIATGNNASSIGPVTVASGAVLTISSGCVYKVL